MSIWRQSHQEFQSAAAVEQEIQLSFDDKQEVFVKLEVGTKATVNKLLSEVDAAVCPLLNAKDKIFEEIADLEQRAMVFNNTFK